MNKVKLYTVVIGELRPYLSRKKRRAQMQALELISSQHGFVGIHRVFGRGTLLLYRTENDAKIARNELISRGCPCGDNICQAFVDKQYVPDEPPT